MTDENILDNLDPEAMDNLVGFFELLIKIDQRINPNDYGISVIDKEGSSIVELKKVY